MCGKFPPARIFDLPECEAVSGATGDALPSAKALMEKSPRGIARLPDKFGGPDDASLFAFINALRLSVRAKVVAEQRRGLPLAEIVILVREMVRLTEEATSHSRPTGSLAFRSISRQAVAWCLEAYRPPAARGQIARDRFPLQSPT
ncbi:MAG: hypothetical protein DMD30_11690 [Gemmatimonadetes bacterium]|nr:MAG: hypothetical protein DMD30_11690 [Gemmatimonadota bacterium]